MKESPDRILARRLEAVEAVAGLWCHEALLRLRPGAPSAVERVAGGVIAYAGAGSPLTRGRGLGMEGPVTAEEVDRLEDFFRSRGVLASLGVSPYADPTLIEQLGRRGFVLEEFDHVLVRPLSGAERPSPLPEGVCVSRAEPADAEAWSRVVGQGFSGEEEVSPGAMDAGLMLFHEPRAACFWAHVDGRPAGGGAMAFHDGLASLFATSTRPEFRGRGVQRALIEARLAHAAASGCELASVVTAPGSASYRNMERAGFRVVYTRVVLTKRWD
ncbi:hypothetical protein SOCE26_017450 [Sorangium cellulosum]|uniref:N-acetyltransferase domain-containing protein n=1 Tax=Sorangium cellulosum TaxID=56 RepID=A0A2L0EM29_SORCE|nr:GNAT family N-acetyltransferase [Sorangium cellulosum]AUX40345.1 hypothetical protein SOCE26_017450 [Sorangium cellulosum]